jgi:transcriptional regulator with XRE-family HTH domain
MTKDLVGARRALGLQTRRQAADFFGVKENTVYRWETGRTKVPDYVSRTLQLLKQFETNRQLSNRLMVFADAGADGLIRLAFRNFRLGKGWSASDLAAAANVSRSWIVHFEMHSSHPSTELLSAALKALATAGEGVRGIHAVEELIEPLDETSAKILLALVLREVETRSKMVIAEARTWLGAVPPTP